MQHNRLPRAWSIPHFREIFGYLVGPMPYIWRSSCMMTNVRIHSTQALFLIFYQHHVMKWLLLERAGLVLTSLHTTCRMMTTFCTYMNQHTHFTSFHFNKLYLYVCMQASISESIRIPLTTTPSHINGMELGDLNTMHTQSQPKPQSIRSHHLYIDGYNEGLHAIPYMLVLLVHTCHTWLHLIDILQHINPSVES